MPRRRTGYPQAVAGGRVTMGLRLGGLTVDRIVRRARRVAAVAAAFTLLQGAPAGASPQTVFVQPSKTLVRQAVTVDAGGRFSYPLPLAQGSLLHFEFDVVGGLTNSVTVGLLDQDNLDNLKARSPYGYIPNTEQTVRGTGRYTFLVPRSGTYYLLVDNSSAWFGSRDVNVYVYVLHPRPTAWSLEFQHTTQDLYDALKAWFVFGDFKVTYRHCGVENAFSSPDITICLELIERFREQGIHGAYPFVLFHELGHTLLRVWGDSEFGDEDVADEFAVMASILLDLQANAQEAARWFAGRTFEIEAGARLWMVDRHTVSPQRARNILRWLNEPEDLMHRWLPRLAPHMRTDYLTQLDGRTSGWVDHALIRAELTRRVPASAGAPMPVR